MFPPLLTQITIQDKRVFLRADLNVPLSPEGQISDDYRLKAILPTLDYLIENNATIILATHLGRPTAGQFDPGLSTKHLVPWFEERGYPVDHQANLETAYQKGIKQSGSILLLENLRFLPGEKKGDILLAQQLARLADVYINDAFGTMHRADTSVTTLARQFKTLQQRNWANRATGAS